MLAKRRTVLGFAFFAKNVATTTTYNSYGLMLPLLLQDFSSGASQVAMGIGLISLVTGVASPWVGRLLDKWSLHGTLVAGCLIAALGYFLASRAHSAAHFVLLYGVLGGLGVTAMGNLPAMKLASLSFPLKKGKAIGFAMLPVSGIVGPFVCAPLLAAGGWRFLLQVFALVLVILAVAAPWVVGLLKRADEDSMAVTPAGRVFEFPLATPNAQPTAIVALGLGSFAFTEFAANQVGTLRFPG